jgi:O-antigen/teichoic acid export membrane protein
VIARTRILKGLGASAYARLVTLISQVLLIPLLVTRWGPTGYGEWLALTALASFVSYSSLGLAQAIRSEVALTLSSRGEAAAAEVFRAGLSLILMFCCLGALAFWAFISWVDISGFLKLTVLSPTAAVLILWLFVGQIIVNLIGGVVAAGLSAVGSYGLAQFVDANRQLGDFLLMLVLVGLLHRPAAGAALIFPATASLALLANTLFLIAKAPWIVRSGAHLRLAALAPLWRPTLGSFLLNFGYTGLIVQAPRLIIATTMGPSFVAVYAVASMLLRLVRIPIEIPSFSATVEMSTAFGAGDRPLAQRLLVTASRFSVWIGIILIPLTVAFGPLAVHVWSNGRLEAPYGLVVALGLSTAAFAFGLPGQEGLMALNRLLTASGWLVLLSAPFAMACYALTKAEGLLGAGLAVLALEGIFAVLVVRQCLKLFDYPAGGYLAALAKPPFEVLVQEWVGLRAFLKAARPS